MTTGHWYLSGVAFTKRHFPWLSRPTDKAKSFSREFLHSLAFSGLELEPCDILLFSHVAALLAFLICLTAAIITLTICTIIQQPLDLLLLAGLILSFVIVPFTAMNAIAAYPSSYAKYARIQSLGDVPEILSYLVMSLKIVPNLENSVKFAATESKTHLAADLRKLLWDMEIRLYHGIDEALTAFSQYWGQWHEYLRRSLHLIKASICEHDEVSRSLTLDRALEVSLDGTKELMNKFVNALHQPTMILYSVGIMIPLSLVAMLPAASLVGIHLSLLEVFLLYDVGIPIFVFIFMWRILLSRPAAFAPPRISPTHPDLKNIHTLQEGCIALLIGGLIAVPFVLSLSSWSGIFARIKGIIPLSLFLIWGITGGGSWYCLRVYTPYKRIRDGIKAMEREFSDALYVLGKRLAEDRSPEESIQFTAQAMVGTKISEVLAHTGYLLQTMNISLRDAFFHPEFGSLKYVSSDRIKALTRLIVEGIQKSQQAVSLSIIRIADHLRDLQDVEAKIRDMLNELTSTLRATTTVFAPLIAGVTLSITTLIASILSSVQSQFSVIPEDSSLSMLPISTAFSAQNIQPEYFILIIGVYLLELVVLLTRFTNGINEGDDRSLFMYSLGRTMIVAVVIFSLTVILGQYFFLGFVPHV